MFSFFGRRGAVAVCIMLSACAAGPSGAAGGTQPNTTYGAFLAAHYAAAQNDPASAAAFYAKALQTAPNNHEIITEGFLASVLAGSKQATTLALKLPSNTVATLVLGNQAAANGNFDQATLLFATLPQDDLVGLIKPLLLAWGKFGQGNEQAALNGLVPHFSSNVFGPVYALNAALIADAAGDNKTAAQLYNTVAADQPNLRLAQILSSWQARQGHEAQAQAVLTALIAAHPNLRIALPALQAQMNKPVITTAAQGMAEAYLTLAGSLDQPQAAFLRTVFLRFALQLRPDLSPARLLLASTQTGGNSPNFTATPTEMQNALDTLAPIGQADPLYGPAALERANLLAALNQPDQAVTLLQGLLAANPDDAGLLATTGDVLRSAEKYGEALPYYTKAIAAVGNPPPPNAWSLFFDRGICEDLTGNWAAAAADMQQALKLSPNQPYVLNYIAYSWAQHGQNLAEAKAMLTRAVALDPNDGAVLDSLGYVELKQGNTKDALDLFIQAAELDPNDAEVNGHLGDAFWQAGQKLQAAYQWQRALSLHPDPKLAAELQAKIEQHFGTAK